jgi:hypothetical protein
MAVTMSSVVVTAGSAINSPTAGENDGHASRLEEIVVPRIGEVNGSLPSVLFAHFTEEHFRPE